MLKLNFKRTSTIEGPSFHFFKGKISEHSPNVSYSLARYYSSMKILFMVVIPNLNYSDKLETIPNEKYIIQDSHPSLIDQRIESAVKLIREKGPVRRKELETVWGIILNFQKFSD